MTAFAAGIGITPIRAMLDELPIEASATLLYRVASEASAPLKSELESLALEKNINLVFLAGTRVDHPMTLEYIQQFAANIADSDIYVCGPHTFMDEVIRFAISAGVPTNRIHHESFAF